jgi:hypothetical protein
MDKPPPMAVVVRLLVEAILFSNHVECLEGELRLPLSR